MIVRDEFFEQQPELNNIQKNLNIEKYKSKFNQ